MRAVIFANGSLGDPSAARAAIQRDDLLIAANGGTQNSLSLHMRPAVIIGDLDSLSPDLLEELRAQGTHFAIHPRDKDQTDLELAVRYAIEQGVQEILFLGLLGGRLDQTLANLLLLALPDWGRIRFVVVSGPDTAHFLREGDHVLIEGQAGDLVSLLPLSPQVSGVTTLGLRWPLDAAELHFGSTRGISNEIIEHPVQIQIDGGYLLVVHRETSFSG